MNFFSNCKKLVGLLILMGGIQISAEAQTPDTTVNTRYNEIKPMLSPDGSKLYFTRSNHPLNSGGKQDRGDVWIANVTAANQWNGVQKGKKAFNSSQVNMVVGFSADSKYVYFQTYNPETKGKSQSGLYKVQANAIDPTPEPVEVKYFFNKAVYQDISIDPTGKIMLLALESYSTFGLEDLYVSFLQPDGSWSEPKNLGQTINTTKQEMSAYLASDGKTLYFTSNGHGGYGSMDIFMSKRLDESWKNWSTPVNLGAEVNTAGADIYYFSPAFGEWDYFSSTKNSEGFGDVRRIRKPEPPKPVEEPVVQVEEPKEVKVVEASPEVTETVVEEAKESIVKVTEPEEEVTYSLVGKLIENKTSKPVNGLLLIKDVNGKLIDSISVTGTYEVSLLEKGKYKITAKAKGYFAQDSLVAVNAGTNQLSFNLRPLEVGATIRLQDVHFKQSTAVLFEESFSALNEVVELMKENPEMEILLTGHTDNQGSSKANIKLSRERVEAVKNYMVSRGIDEKRIEGKGFGGTKPIASNASEETRKLNRRVEFTIVKK